MVYTHTHNGILFSHENEGNPVICDMDGPEGITLNEISQAEKSKYYMISFICEGFFWPHLQHVEVPVPGIKPTPQLRSTPQLQKCQILNSLGHKGTSSYRESKKKKKNWEFLL